MITAGHTWYFKALFVGRKGLVPYRACSPNITNVSLQSIQGKKRKNTTWVYVILWPVSPLVYSAQYERRGEDMEYNYFHNFGI